MKLRQNKEKVCGILLLFVILIFPQKGFAQEYEYEIGGTLGTSFYMGDANKSKLFQSPHLATGVIFRYNRNFRWAYKGNFLIGGVSGDTRKSGNVFPGGENASFSRTFYELGGQVEYNFFHYSDKYQYLGTRRLSPYLFTGLGVTYGSGDKSFFGANLPLGIGLKYKWKERLNVGFEFSFRKLFGDSFDVTSKSDGFNLEDPYKIESNFFKNKDWYVLTMFSITWDFGVRSKSCINSLY
ncbi:type IX secretion system protein PorG [Dysgonomonas macrotermitis]|uniref:DUF6089 domain-containing protein n=1 Tax=Dysgonomonas macrotermitis TaxID=1346286 RepID=A0A1M5CDA4_9BACT|nr:DUF6089 family protein [Dysgonomonas macrotermitis]SHF52718.1 hypothetical protein SAMN05444362_107127 [Dysgonomonas macrotermitis]